MLSRSRCEPGRGSIALVPTKRGGSGGDVDPLYDALGYRTTAGGGIAGVDYRTNGFVFGLGAGFLASDVRWRDVGRSTGNIDTAVVGAYGGATFGPALLEGAVAATYSDMTLTDASWFAA